MSYLSSDLITPVDLQPHYNLRAFYSDNTTVPWTMNDMRLWNAYYFASFNMQTLGSPRSTSGRTLRFRTTSELDALAMSSLDGTFMIDLDTYPVSMGNEEWPVTDPNVTVAKDPTYRYQNTLTVTLTDNVLETVPSHYADDIVTGLDNPTTPYYIELVLRNFPAQGAAAHLNLSSSYIDFSSDDNFDPTLTDSIPFSASLNSLTSGGDITWKIDRNLLANSDPSNLRAIRFRLLSVGAMTFKAQAMRVIPAGAVFDPIELNTRRNLLTRSLPETGSPEWTSVMGDLYFDDSRPKNATHIIKFNSGHNPTGNDNILRMYYRYVPSFSAAATSLYNQGTYGSALYGTVNSNTYSRLEVDLYARDTQSRLRIYETINNSTTEIFSTPINTNALTNETDYFLQIEVIDTQVRATIYTTLGVFFGSQVYTTGWQTVTRIARGATGFSLEPYNYDFGISYIATQRAQFASFLSTSFSSHSPVVGASIKTLTSAAEDRMHGAGLVANGDASVSQDASGTFTITRDGTNWYGGLRHDTTLDLGDSSKVTLSGSIYPLGSFRGNFVAAIVDENDSVSWINTLTGILPNQWNDFSILLPDGIIPIGSGLWLHENGFYNDSFRIKSVVLSHDTVSWDASPDAGATWQPFLNVTNEDFGAIHFGTPNTQLKVRANALLDSGWIAGYELKPHYKYPGHR